MEQNRVHIDAKAQEINHGSHCANSSNGCFPFCLVRINEIHHVLRHGFYLVGHVAIDKKLVPLQKEDQGLDRIGFNVQACNFFSCKITLENMRREDLGDQLESNLGRLNICVVLIFGCIEHHPDKVSKVTSSSSPRLVQNHLHSL